MRAAEENGARVLTYTMAWESRELTTLGTHPWHDCGRTAEDDKTMKEIARGSVSTR